MHKLTDQDKATFLTYRQLGRLIFCHSHLIVWG